MTSCKIAKLLNQRITIYYEKGYLMIANKQFN